MKAPFVIGRMVFGGYFIYSGIHHFLEAEALTKYTKAKGVPRPDLAVRASGAALVGFLAAVTPTMHDFWSHRDPKERQNEMVNFGKNLALTGAALALAAI